MVDEELHPSVIDGVNHPHKSKNKKGSSCSLCKPYKNGKGRATSDKNIAEMESQIKHGRPPKASQHSRRNAWRVKEFRWYTNEFTGYGNYGDNKKRAKEVYDLLAKKVQTPGSHRYGVQLLDPEDNVVAECKAKNIPQMHQI